MNFLKNIKIKGKLSLMLALPLIALLYFSQAEIQNRWSVSTEMTNLQALSQLAVSSSNLVHELQKERGATAGFLGSKGQKFSAELKRQRQATDQKANALDKTLEEFDVSLLPQRSQGALGTVMASLNKITLTRGKVDGFNIGTGEAIGYYTGLNTAYLAIIGSMVEVTTDADYSRQLTAYGDFLQAKERAGIERAVMSNTFAADKFGPGMFSKFNFLMAKQEAYTDAFLTVATREHIQYYHKTLTGEFVDEVKRMRGIALAKASEGNFEIDATYWFKTITGKINLLKNVEDYLSAELQTDANMLQSSASTALMFTAILVLVVLSITLLLSFTIARSILLPLAKVVGLTTEMNKEFNGFEEVVDAIAHNDLTRKVQRSKIEKIGLDSKDEIGQLVAAIEQTIEGKDRIGVSLERMTTNLRTMVGNLGDNARELTSAASEIASSSEQMSRGSRDQSEQVGQVSTAVEEMSATIIESSKNAADATAASRGASETATTGGQIVSETIQGMQKIADVVRKSAGSIVKLATSADQIGEIVSVIDDIADQTNLLALNAAIEAARAGEQGRGFAVVADEVRKLAERTAKATGEITGMIKGIQNETDEAVNSMEAGVQEVDKGRELADKAGTSLSEIVQMSTRVLDMMQQIATATEEQSTTAEQIAKNVENVATIAQETSKGAEQSATAAEQLSRQAESLQSMVSQFKTE